MQSKHLLAPVRSAKHSAASLYRKYHWVIIIAGVLVFFAITSSNLMLASKTFPSSELPVSTILMRPV